MSESKFKVGDRVKIYCHGGEVPGADFIDTERIWSGTVKGSCDARGVLAIHPDNAPDCVRASAHAKACRKLVKKGRRFHGKWKRVQNPDGTWSIGFIPQGPYDTFDMLIGFEMDLIEVRRGK